MQPREETAVYAPMPEDVVHAARRIDTLVVNTPVLRPVELSDKLGINLSLKCENLQRSGSFKFRGASNAVIGLLEDGLKGGVATHSSGNHGYALSLAAKLHNLSAEVVAPRNAVKSKLLAIQQAGGILHLCDPTQAAREAGLARLVARGLTPVPPYDHPLVIAGQGTAALELLNQEIKLDGIITPLGGGGLLAGTLLALRYRNADIPVYAAEPEGADDTWRSLQLGERISDFQPDTIADGLRALVGEITFPIIQRHVSGILRVSDAETVAAMKLMWESLNLIVEASSATVLAALIRYREQFAGQRIAAIISGGNVDLGRIPFLEASMKDSD